ncbi:MAG: DeoR/GlpR transcriptional regulator [Tyzzerella sp.]|nr:DeoR/GlpR transcriptional regulator [Tyzzerella sp.]
MQNLEQKGFVKRVYDGVVLSEYSNEVVPVSLRDRENAELKERIAAEAAKLIKDNDTVIFDASSTVRRICRHIKNRKNLTIITNNLRICEELKDSDISVYCTGGALTRKRDCFLGHFLSDFF